MKPIYTIFFLFLISSLVSCNKEKIPNQKRVVGKFDWKESLSSQNNGPSSGPLYTYTPGNIGRNYGIRIKRNKKIFFYEDGKLLEESIITEYKNFSSNLTEGVQITTSFRGTPIVIEWYENQILTCNDWPHLDFDNYFTDIKSDL